MLKSFNHLKGTRFTLGMIKCMRTSTECVTFIPIDSIHIKISQTKVLQVYFSWAITLQPKGLNSKAIDPKYS